MTRTTIYEVTDTLIPAHIVLKWEDTYGNVFKKRRGSIDIFFRIT
jgi:hypothetical protein